MTKTFCDRCCKEGPVRAITISELRILRDEAGIKSTATAPHQSSELCDKCLSDVLKAMGPQF